jgi:hypothetical protein
MTTYPIEFHRRLEHKWASRIEQIPKSQAPHPHREIPTTTIVTRTRMNYATNARGD